MSVLLAQQVLRAARDRHITIATAESCSGGLIAGALTAIPGASTVFDRGFVTYSNAAKVQMLGVRHETLERHGAVSEAVAREMSEGALDRADAWAAIAVTGVAGPGGTAAKPEGRVCFALAHEGRDTRVETVDFGAIGRDAVRIATVEHGLRMLLDALAPDQP